MSQEPLRHDEIQGKIVHIYDGIEEADNTLPRWWLATFFGAIIFGVFYWMYYESYKIGDYPNEAFTKERLAAMDKGGPVTEEDLVALVSDAPMVAAGQSAFVKNCTKCHGNQAEGMEGQGPNLTDNAWLHGGSPIEIYTTIANGAANGMPSWGPVLGKGVTKQLAAYVISLRDTNVPGKAPQGEPWVPSVPPSDE